MDFEIGKKIGDYEVIGVLGTGGMGKVYKVRNTISERAEAMKVLLPNLANDPDLEGRFLREIKLLATLDHPNIASLRTALRVENQLLMVMEFVEGTTLAQRLQQGAPPLSETVDCMCQVLSALSYAHERGVIHRDIKPANMMLTTGGVVKLMDFGIAKATADPKMTGTGQTLGSLSYMSPEQVKAEPLDARSDIYSLGVSLYELVIGRRPFKEDSDYALMAAHLQKTPVPPIQLDPGLPPDLNAIVLMAMAKDPASRFQSAAAFRKALESVKSTLGPASFAVGAGSVAAGTAGLTTPLGGPPPGWASGPAPGVMPPTATARVGEVPTQPLGGAPTSASAFGMPATPSRPPQPVPGSVTTAPVQPGPAVVPPYPAALPAPARSYRGFYMTAGALIAVAVIVLAATQIPKWYKAKAGGASPLTMPDASAASSSSSVPSAPVEPQASEAPAPQGTPSDQPSQGQTGPSQASPGQNATVPAAPGQTAIDRGQPGATTPPSTGTAGTTPGQPVHPARPARRISQPPPVSSQPAPAAAMNPASAPSTPGTGAVNAGKLKELHKRLTLLAARGRAVKSSFERLQQQQAAQGFSPRRDMAAALDRMNQFMDEAHDALAAGDTGSAEENMDSAEREVATLEKFFGG